VGSKYAKRYSEEFKRDAVTLARSSDRTVTEIARELGVSAEGLRSWVRKAEAQPANSTSAKTAAEGALSAAERDELKRLRKLAAEQAKTIEILKKATAFFARESDR
jgi:transposase